MQFNPDQGIKETITCSSVPARELKKTSHAV